MAHERFGHIHIFLSVLLGLVTKGDTADLCPYDSSDEYFGRNTKFRFCSGGCCGKASHDVCCNDVRTEIIVGCVVGGIVVLTFVVIAACCYYARFARPRRIARIRRATIMVPSTVYHTRAQHEIIGDGQHHARENAMQLPPPYEVVIENSKTQDKPPSYDDVIKDDSSTALKNNETSYR
ncbi:uncharacterized protein LOC121392725 isoform X1 [Gigantopelta aegis]|uniref:uncharacterized protein LOC121392725 isoform X1 n=1 Tax=Gigantopelta aegis TaxID=1735272 RepID=UPI001B88A5E9|nr:uncharacterized protein LOC121392725 isoform X1 [Gigantopelta aegis]